MKKEPCRIWKRRQYISKTDKKESFVTRERLFLITWQRKRAFYAIARS